MDQFVAMFIENVVILSKSEYRQVKCCGSISVSKERKLYAKSLMDAKVIGKAHRSAVYADREGVEWRGSSRKVENQVVK